MPGCLRKFKRQLMLIMVNYQLKKLCFAFSPMGEIFRARLRQFPALVNNCTIDWFSEWPVDALRSVAMKFLMESPELTSSEDIVNGLVRFLKIFPSFFTD